MGLVKVVVQLKNDIPEVKPEQYISLVQVRSSLRVRGRSVLGSGVARRCLTALILSLAVRRHGSAGPDPQRGRHPANAARVGQD